MKYGCRSDAGWHTQRTPAFLIRPQAVRRLRRLYSRVVPDDTAVSYRATQLCRIVLHSCVVSCYTAVSCHATQLCRVMLHSCVVPGCTAGRCVEMAGRNTNDTNYTDKKSNGN